MLPFMGNIITGLTNKASRIRDLNPVEEQIKVEVGDLIEGAAIAQSV
jgi:hypothetical protein